MDIELEPAYGCPDETALLFSEYTSLLTEIDGSFQQYLELQNYSEELANPQKKYSPPDGRLYLARCDGKLAGCIALKKIDALSCEMKRLYVRPQFRGSHIGSVLVRRIIEDARSIGYERMMLDTFPSLKSAIQLYKKYGFHEIPCYNNNPMKDALYMQLDL